MSRLDPSGSPLWFKSVTRLLKRPPRTRRVARWEGELQISLSAYGFGGNVAGKSHMPTPSKILWTLDNETAPKQFERLCVDLLLRDGYHEIVPVGGHHDHGRDAEIRYWNGSNQVHIPTVFQFSLEQKWENKLRKDVTTILAHHPETKAIVFVTSRDVSGRKQDELRDEFRKMIGCELAIYAREWLRIRLEEVHQDLALKHLGLDLPPTVGAGESAIIEMGLDDESAAELFRHTSPELVRATLTERTKKNPKDCEAWRALAQVTYHLRDYTDALRCVNKSCDLNPKNMNATLLKGAILAEMGIAKSSRPLLLQSKPIFEMAVSKLNRSVDHYNLANVLGALHEYGEAEKHYRTCLEKEPTAYRAWKNLGSLVFRRGDHEEEMACYDKALSLNPDCVEALLCKANTYAVAMREPAKAIECFTQAYTIDPDLDRRWKHARYWFAYALMEAGQMEDALKQADVGLVNAPDTTYLLNQKAAILAALWKKQKSYEDIAFEFFKFRASAIRNDYPGLDELIQIALKRGALEDAWTYVDRTLDAGDLSIKQLATRAGISLEDVRMGCEHIAAYRKYRDSVSLERHFVWLHGYGLHPNQGIQNALFQLLLIPYSEALAALKDRAAVDRETWEQTLKTLLGRIASIFCAFGSSWLAPKVPDDVVKHSEILSKGLFYLVDVVVTEATSQLGFLAGLRNEPDESLSGLGDGKWKWLYDDVMSRLIDNLPDEWIVGTRQ